MFDQLKDIYNLKKQAEAMEKQLAAERIEGQSSNGLVKIVINGKHDILEVEISDREKYDKKEVAQSVKEAYAKAQASLQKILMEKFRGMI